MFIIESNEGYWNNNEGWMEHKEDATLFDSNDYDLPIGQNVRWVGV